MMNARGIVKLSAVVVLFLIGAFLRLWQLGAAAFGADNMDFFRYALANHRILDLWMNPPWLNQIPLNETFTLLLIKVGLPATPFVTRLPFAIMGILALVLIWRFANRRFGTGAAFCVLILAVFNPFQIYYARTAYHYAGATCWSAAMFMVFWRIREQLACGICPRVRLVGLWAMTAILACHMHMSVWIVAGVQGLLIFIIGVLALRADRLARWRFVMLIAGAGGLLAVAMSRWVYRAVLEMERVASAGGHIGSPVGGVLKQLFPMFFAGENLPAVWLLVAVVAVAVVALIKALRQKTAFASFAMIAGLQVLLLMLYVGVAGGGLGKVTYFSAIWPLFIWFLGVGLWQGSAVLSAGRRWVQYWVVGVVLAAYAILVLPPAWAIVNLEGKLMPTFKINDWVLNNLPTGTPVLVDRWFHPWNEMAIHNADQINYTFTVPDEPVENYRALNWRETAASFFEKYPQAALLEVNPGKYKDKIGPWHFPEQHFARVASITNTAVVTLQQYCVYPLGRSHLKNGEKPCLYRIFYNTTEDLMAAARQKNESTLRLYGDGWSYLKPWQPIQGWPQQLMQALWIQAGMYAGSGKTLSSLDDLNMMPQTQAMQYLNQGRWADYRIPGAQSKLRLFNLTEAELPATLTVTGIALSGNVGCKIGSEVVLFPQTLMTERRLPLTLKPGENEVIVAIPPNQLLLVHDVRLTSN